MPRAALEGSLLQDYALPPSVCNPLSQVTPMIEINPRVKARDTVTAFTLMLFRLSSSSHVLEARFLTTLIPGWDSQLVCWHGTFSF